MRSRQICLLLLWALCAGFPNGAFQVSRSDSTWDGGVEAIYVVRSMLESRVTATKALLKNKLTLCGTNCGFSGVFRSLFRK